MLEHEAAVIAAAERILFERQLDLLEPVVRRIVGETLSPLWMRLQEHAGQIAMLEERLRILESLFLGEED